MSADGVSTKKRLFDDGETNIAKEARVVRGLTSIAMPLSKSYFESMAEKRGYCDVCAAEGKQKHASDKDVKFGWCHCCRERACQTHLLCVRDSNICTTCCATASLCARCKRVAMCATIVGEAGQEEYCARCAKVFETKKKNADLVLVDTARLVTDRDFAELLENCDAVYDDEDEERPSCGLCDETCVVICDWCGEPSCNKHLYEVLPDGEHVCTACLPKATFCTSCKNALGDLDSGLCNDCKWIEISRREKLECDNCKKQVEVRDTERVGYEGNACFDCTYQEKIKQL